MKLFPRHPWTPLPCLGRGLLQNALHRADSLATLFGGGHHATSAGKQWRTIDTSIADANMIAAIGFIRDGASRSLRRANRNCRSRVRRMGGSAEYGCKDKSYCRRKSKARLAHHLAFSCVGFIAAIEGLDFFDLVAFQRDAYCAWTGLPVGIGAALVGLPPVIGGLLAGNVVKVQP